MYARNNVVSTGSAASSNSRSGTTWTLESFASMEGENKIRTSDVAVSIPAGSSAFNQRDNLNRISAKYRTNANVARIKSFPSTQIRVDDGAFLPGGPEEDISVCLE